MKKIVIKTVFEFDKQLNVISDNEMSFEKFKMWCQENVNDWNTTLVSTTTGEVFTVKHLLTN